MNVDVAGEALREFLVNQLLVRFAMATGTLGDKPVPILVAGDAGDLLVLAGVLRYRIKFLGVAGATRARRYILAVGDP
ncbi:MAG: hypothetical protein A2X79_00040 [Desulfuromonadaceae bacterium GWB2_53_15]|nr:MAG: hypothetical protein A2X83_10810 [Desulfuromonadales bacterium GWD2_54_10]OHB33511.1 MAG: hypothetical protein A2X79_00040 [Desulfuromonadaceae bacterium GWB2_53_15]